MSASAYVFGIYALPLIVIVSGYLLVRWRREVRSARDLREAIESGLTEPASLHPLIDPLRCIGCGSCISVCPEGDVLGLIHNTATLVNPVDCIGHGACEKACPENAISLVFGTGNRGVDIPDLSPRFETTVPGIFVAGELAGMGLIKNAIEQGQQAMSSIAALTATSAVVQDWDCVIVGCGPAGLSAALQAQIDGVRALALDRHRLGGTVTHFPRRKVVMTAPVVLAGVGRVEFREVEKEALISFWEKVVADRQPTIRQGETLLDIDVLDGGGFRVCTDLDCYSTRTVLLAMGRRGIPRTLNVPGEELSKVVYELDDPAQYLGRKVMVVGGGDSALEAAAGIARAEGATVTLSYRGDAFSRAKRKNRKALEDLVERGAIDLRLSSSLLRITPQEVVLEQGATEMAIPNDDVIVCIGGELPLGFMRSLGISVSTKYGER